MDDFITERLTGAKRRVLAAQKAVRLRDRTRREIRREEAREKKFARTLAKERADVERLEGLSIDALFEKVFGNMEKRLAKEKGEYVAAKLKHEDSLQAIAEFRKDLAQHDEAAADLFLAEEEYEAALDSKERVLRAGRGRAKELLLGFAEQTAELRSRRKELLQAVAAGDEALEAMEVVRDTLQSAGNWGTWDVIGGGLIAASIKHGKLNEARRAAARARRCLVRFEAELSDVRGACRESLEVEVGEFLTFADYFFDGLIADLTVLSKINRTQAVVDQELRRLEGLRRSLDPELARLESDLAEAETARRELIEGV